MLQRTEKRRRREAVKASNHNGATEGSVVQVVWSSFRHVIYTMSFAIKLLVQKLLLFCWWLICTGIALSEYTMLVGIRAVLLRDMMHDLLLCYVSLLVFGGVEFILLEITPMIPWYTMVTFICPMMIAIITIDVMARLASKTGFKSDLPRLLKVEGLVRAYYSATEPLYVVSPEEQARIDRKREQIKQAVQRSRAKAKANAEQDQANRDEDKERKARQ